MFGSNEVYDHVSNVDNDITYNVTAYGVDVSFPIHHHIDSQKYPHFSDNYQKFIKGCHHYYNREDCDANEDQRMSMNLEQPRTQLNYTSMGFEKRKMPNQLFEVLSSYFNQYRHTAASESWPDASVYVNHWDRPTSFITTENKAFRGDNLDNFIWDTVQPIIEEWVGRRVVPVSLYGIRIYHEGHILSTHVDRIPLVSSAILQVSQDVDEPWPIEVYGRDGLAYNVTMAPGDMVLYESHTTLHGRPFPLKGRYYVSDFITC